MNRVLRFFDIKTLFKFGIVGIIATLVHIAASFLFLNGFGINVHLSNFLGFLIAFLFSFSGQYFWTFKTTRSVKTALPRFFLVSFSAYLFSAGVLFTLSHFSLPPDIKLLFSICVIPVYTFVLSKIYAFKDT